MKIMIINPDYGMTEKELFDRVDILKKYVSSGTEIVMECLKENHVYIDSMFDVFLAGSEIISMAKKAEDEGFDAVVLYCFSDPAISACREALNIPVIGGGQSSYLTALNISRQFGIILADKSRIGEKKLFVHETGVASERVSGIYSADIDWNEDKASIFQKLQNTGNKLIEDGADAVILGCLSFLGLGEELSKSLGVPVIDAGISSVSMAESLVKQGVKTSKKGYSKPPTGKRTWSGGTIEI